MEMLHQLGEDVSADLPLVRLDDVHQLVVVQIGLEFLHGLGGQLAQQVGLFVVIDLRVIDQLIDDDSIRLVDDDPPFADDDIQAVLLLAELLTRISSETGW